MTASNEPRQGAWVGTHFESLRMSPLGTKLKFTALHGYGGLPPHCRRSGVYVGLSAHF